MASQTQKIKDAAEGNPADAAPADLITGETAGTEPANVNLTGLTNVDGVEEGDQLEADNTPQIQSLILQHQPHGTTTLSARVMDPATGWVNRNCAIPGRATAQQVAAAIANIASWS